MSQQKKEPCLQPTFYKDFKCSGGDCKLNCCKYDWNIFVDKATYKKYKSIKEPKELVEKINKCIKRTKSFENNFNYSKIILEKEYKETIIENTEKESVHISKIIDKVYCPLITDKGLCMLQNQLGYDGLCYTCQSFPRITIKFDDRIERTLGCGCEEACKLMFNHKNGIDFEFTETKPEKYNTLILLHNPNKEEKTLNYFQIIREASIDILQNRELSLDNRFILLGVYLNKIDEFYKTNKPTEISAFTNTVLNNADSFKFLFDITNRRYDIAFMLFSALSNKIISHPSSYSERQITAGAHNAIYNAFDKENNEIKSYNNYEKLQSNRNMIMADYEYYLENIMVNNFFSNAYPLAKTEEDEICVFNNYLKFAWSYCYLKMMVCGMLVNKTELNIDDLFALTTIYGRQLANHKTVLTNTVEIIKKNGLDNMASIALLIKSS